MSSDLDDLDLGLQDLRWPTPEVPVPPPGDAPAGAPVPHPRDSVPDLLEQEIQQARANGAQVPIDVAQQHGFMPTPPATQADQPAPAPPQPAPRPAPRVVNPIQTRLFVAIQTIPDYDRVAKLRLPELPPLPATVEYDSLPNPAEMSEGKALKTLQAFIRNAHPPREWIESLMVAESHGRNRAGVLAYCEEKIREFDVVHQALADRILSLSAVPEYSKIVGVAFAGGAGPVHSVVVGQQNRNQQDVTERAILALFWQSLKMVETLVCWGDPRSLLYTRSCLVGVSPKSVGPIHLEDLSRFVVGARDLGPHTLEETCEVYGLDVPLDPLPNQLVVSDSWTRGDFTGVQQSAQIRLTMLRRLWQKWEGFHVGGSSDLEF